MMGSLGTPGDQPRKLLENMATKFLIWKVLLEHLETSPENFWKMPWKEKLDQLGKIKKSIVDNIFYQKNNANYSQQN